MPAHSLPSARQWPALRNLGATVVNESQHYFVHSLIQGMPENPNSWPDSGRGGWGSKTHKTPSCHLGVLVDWYNAGGFVCEDGSDGLDNGGAARDGLQPMAELLESL